jgi:uracil-DNA glycosylase family 4
MFDNICIKLQDCQECPYSDYEVNQWNFEKGYGKLGCYYTGVDPRIMIVGQNPSNKRYKGCHSLSGKQGDVFRQIFSEEDLIFTNVLPVSSPTNKITVEEAMHGLVHLREQIYYFDPKLILCLGSIAKQVLISEAGQKALMNHDGYSKVHYLKHPDYYLSYRRGDWDDYVEQIRNIKLLWQS